MKRVILLLSLVSILSGCVDLAPVKPTRSTGGNSLYGDTTEPLNDETTYEVDIAGQFQQQNERAQQLMNLASQRFSNLTKVALEVTTKANVQGTEIVKQQRNEEVYQEGSLSDYFIDATQTVQGETLHQGVILQGEKNYRQALNGQWIETASEGRNGILYLYLVKLLFEGQDQWEVSDGLSVATVRKQINDATVLSGIETLLDVPVIVSPQAKKSVTLDYQIDEETGDILVALVNMTIEDLNQTTTMSVQARINSEATFEDWVVDTSEVETAAEDDFIAAFQKANQTKALTYYETYVNEVSGEEIERQLILGNYIADTPYMLLQGRIADESFQDVSVTIDGQKFSQVEEQVTVESDTALNLYALYVDAFVNHYDQLTLLEDDGSQESTYRLFYEYDFESFQSVAGALDVSRLQNSDTVAYGVDFKVDAKTNELLGVFFWSVGETEESVSQLTTVSFSGLNVNNPNQVSGNISEDIWKTIVEKVN